MGFNSVFKGLKRKLIYIWRCLPIANTKGRENVFIGTAVILVCNQREMEDMSWAESRIFENVEPGGMCVDCKSFSMFEPGSYKCFEFVQR